VSEAPPASSWLHPDVEVRASAIEGQGLFARHAIPGGTAVSVLGGELVSADELRALMEAAERGGPYVDTIAVDEDRHLLLAPGQPNRFGNHSCDPNLWWTGPFTLSTSRPVPAGEELTSDYATSTGFETWAMPCTCGSARCRGVVTGRDWRRPELRRRYGDHWVPALRRRIERERGR
jgi:SET domain-containing protein